MVTPCVILWREWDTWRRTKLCGWKRKQRNFSLLTYLPHWTTPFVCLQCLPYIRCCYKVIKCLVSPHTSRIAAALLTSVCVSAWLPSPHSFLVLVSLASCLYFTCVSWNIYLNFIPHYTTESKDWIIFQGKVRAEYLLRNKGVKVNGKVAKMAVYQLTVQRLNRSLTDFIRLLEPGLPWTNTVRTHAWRNHAMHDRDVGQWRYYHELYGRVSWRTVVS